MHNNPVIRAKSVIKVRTDTANLTMEFPKGQPLQATLRDLIRGLVPECDKGELQSIINEVFDA